jgi:peptide/nickel transport system ATP-binding protein
MTGGPATHPLLEVKGLRALLPTKHGLVRAVDRVSFSLSQGKAFGIVGESGCGKSMLARAIMGLLPPDAMVPSGAIVNFKGQNLIGMSKKQRRSIIGRDIAAIFQDPMTALNPVMKVGQQVAEVVHYHLKTNRQTAHKRAIELLDLVGMPMPERRAKQYPHQLSGGLRQRAAIAIALACDPLLLIADEPTTALDVTVQASILNLLSRLQQRKQMAVILISHDLGVVAQWTHEVAVMYAGKIVEQAPTPALFKDMRMPYTRALMAAMPSIANQPHTTLQAINGQPPDLVNLPVGCRFASRCWKTQPLCTQREPVLESIDGSSHQSACWYPLNEREK